jgi:DNA-binding NtrC family response regulator
MCKILIIEEDPQRRRFYSEALQREGHQVVAVHHGEQAVEMVGYASIDLAVVNLQLVDGKALDYVLKMVSRQHDLKVIASAADETVKREFRAWAVDWFLNDPSDLTELIETIAEILRRPKTPWRQNHLTFKPRKNSNDQTHEKDSRHRACSFYLAGYYAGGGAPGCKRKGTIERRNLSVFGGLPSMSCIFFISSIVLI